MNDTTTHSTNLTHEEENEKFKCEMIRVFENLRDYDESSVHREKINKMISQDDENERDLLKTDLIEMREDITRRHFELYTDEEPVLFNYKNETNVFDFKSLSTIYLTPINDMITFIDSINLKTETSV